MHSTKPVNVNRAKRFELWLQRATDLELDRVYASAIKTCNYYQKGAVVDELRRRELAETNGKDGACGTT